MISVIIPSRDRPHELQTALNSLGLAINGLEALIWLDDDDPQLDKYKELFGTDPNIRLFIKKRVGYIQSHLMLNFLCKQAKYNWIFQFNDDAYMDNPNWFNIFKDFVKQFDPVSEPVVINLWGQGVTVGNLFPIVSRAYHNILGHYSGATTCDEWVRMVATGANISHDLKGIKPKHRKYGGENPLWDKTFREVETDRNENKKHWNEKRGIIPKSLYADIDKIIHYQNNYKTIYHAP